MSSATPITAAFAAFAMIMLAPTVALADVAFQFAVGSGGSWTRSSPTLSTPALTTSAREMGPGRLSPRGGVAMLGVGADVGLTVDARITVPLFGVTRHGAVGTYDPVATSLDGSIAYLRPWSAARTDVLLPGIGYRHVRRRNMVAVGLRTGVGFFQMNGSLAAGAEAVQLELSAASFLLQAEVEACRRLDPAMRICLQAAPRIYDFGLVNGGTLGLRIEWGS